MANISNDERNMIGLPVEGEEEEEEEEEEQDMHIMKLTSRRKWSQKQPK